MTADTTSEAPRVGLELVRCLLDLLEAGVPERELASVLEQGAKFLRDVDEAREARSTP